MLRSIRLLAGGQGWVGSHQPKSASVISQPYCEIFFSLLKSGRLAAKMFDIHTPESCAFDKTYHSLAIRLSYEHLIYLAKLRIVFQKIEFIFYDFLPLFRKSVTILSPQCFSPPLSSGMFIFRHFQIRKVLAILRCVPLFLA